MILHILSFLFFSLVLNSLTVNAQSSISGFIDSISVNKDSFIDLVELNKTSDNNAPKIVASSPIYENGSFSINKILPEKKQLYQLHLRKRINNSIKEYVSPKFFLSNNDTIQFLKSSPPLSYYTNTNKIDKEWKKLSAFKNKLDTSFSNQKKYLNEIRSYSKDSLKILAVKLLSINELYIKGLLTKDIVLNKKYYISLLKELKASDIAPKEYYFLENQLTTIRIEKIENKYLISKWLNIILIGVLISFLYFFFPWKKRTIKTPLSKQETTIKNLIIKGKTNKEIASELFISLSTVKTHITNIYQKLEVSNRNELALKHKNNTGTST